MINFNKIYKIFVRNEKIFVRNDFFAKKCKNFRKE